MRKIRTNFKRGTSDQIKKRNQEMFNKFKKLSNKGKYGRMELYQLLADEYDITERNSVGSIIRTMEKKLIKLSKQSSCCNNTIQSK